jgi:mRNA interferase MazF
MKERDVILVSLPQADGSTKTRPAILLRTFPPFGDFLVCGVSTQLRQRVPDFDEIIARQDADFILSGLRQESLVRLGFLAMLTRSQALGSIGEISSERHKDLLKKLASYLISNSI